MKEKLVQEHVGKGFNSIIPGENWNNFTYYPWKMTVFPVLTLPFHPSLHKMWLSHLHKNYIFEISNRATQLKIFIMLS